MARPIRLGLALVLAAVAGGAFARPAFAQDDEEFEAPPPPPPSDDAQAGSWQDLQPPAQPPDRGTFERRLSRYGHWVDTPEYGRVWVPEGVASDWQPYTDGSWVDTDY